MTWHPRIKGSTDYVGRFWKRVSIEDSGCWIWTGSKDKKGYGRYAARNSHPVLTHVFAWELINALPSPTYKHRMNLTICVKTHLVLIRST